MAIKKVSLLLSPASLSVSDTVMRSLHVTKSGKNISFEEALLDLKEVRRYYAHHPPAVKDAILSFCDEYIVNAKVSANQKLTKQRSGIHPATFKKNHALRYLHRSFESLKPFSGLQKFYHKIMGQNNRFVFSPCVFSQFKPVVSFTVVKKNKGFTVITNVCINGIDYPITDFDRFVFLLHSRNEYFILSFKDYQIIDWLENTDLKAWSADADAFKLNVLQKLEEDYDVDRNNLFPKKEVRNIPVKRVMLSEISNSFLMFTPQWLYDGFVIDGPFSESYKTTLDGEEYVIYRNEEEENAFRNLLQSFHPGFASQRNGYFHLSFAEAQKKQWFLKAYHKMLDAGIELTGIDMLHHFRYSPHKATTETVIKSQQDNGVEIEMTVYFGKEKVDLANLQKMLLAGQKAVMLKDTSLGILSDEWMQQYGTILKHGKVSKNMVVAAKYLAINEQNNHDERVVLKPLVKVEWWQKWRQWHDSDQQLYAMPAGIQATLRPYQQKGFEWLTLLAEAGAGGCLADDMGLGKTLQTICFLAHHIHHNPDDINIIICPSSLIYNWQQEMQKFAPGISTLVFHGTGRNAEDLDKPVQVFITSYGTFRADAGLMQNKFFGVAVIDESHNIKNPAAQVTTAISNMRAGIRIALSGTPVVNNTFDLYSQLNFALPGMFGSREFFKREYADAIDRNHDEEKIKALQKLTAPFILRRTKEQVATDLPEKSEMILWCSMHRQQRDLYNEVKDQVSGSLFLDIKNNGLAKSKFAVILAMLKLRQICNSPKLLPPEEHQGCSQSVKTEMLIDELQNILGNHKALVFSQFATMLDLLAEELDKKGIPYYHFDGQTPPAKRTEMVNAFQEKGNDTHLFLISLKAGNTGLTLTAADYVFLFDPWWNTAVEQQAIDRTHRIGQTRNVFAYKMICKDTIEEKIIVLQQRKKKLAQELVSEDNGFVKELSEEDITYLFS